MVTVLPLIVATNSSLLVYVKGTELLEVGAVMSNAPFPYVFDGMLNEPNPGLALATYNVACNSLAR